MTTKQCWVGAREIPQPAGKSAGLRNDVIWDVALGYVDVRMTIGSVGKNATDVWKPETGSSKLLLWLGWFVGGGRLGRRHRMNWRLRRHRALGIQQVVMVWSEPELDQRSRIRRGLALPAIVGLIFLHRRLRCAVPLSGSFSAQVVFFNERLLDLRRPLCIDFLLSPPV